jgi:hypothetical protein
MADEGESLTLKWGTLKAWRFKQPKMRDLLERYHALGSTWSAMEQRDTPEQKQLICEMIDAGDFDTVYLDWDGEHVSKERAKEYVMDYGKPEPAPVATPTEEQDDG